jgi:ABC-type glycerol-3-phosphate transport system substrate-binding protein/DNA-binding transcriptional regulator YhcF (GntR family)
MRDKVTITRNYIIDLLEKGELKEGDKLLGARAISSILGISFVKIQSAIETLVNDGILETKPRKGTFVQKSWEARILQTNISLFVKEERLPWVSKARTLLDEELPLLQICSAFPNSVFEIMTTITVLRDQNEYLDLSDIFQEVYPDQSDFFSKPFEPFYSDGKLIGIPFIYSPRVMFFNPEILHDSGCKLPKAGWEWDDFITSIRKLRKRLPAEQIFVWNALPHIWMNFVIRAGGALINPEEEDPVKIDKSETIHGLELHTQLKKELGVGLNEDYDNYSKAFFKGEKAFLMGTRESMAFASKDFDSWQTVPLPMIEGGKDLTMQATDLLCVRKSCTNIQIAKDFIKVMLSEKVQDIVGAVNYGIPIRKSSALNSIDFDDPRDTLFLSEASKMTGEYNMDSPEIYGLIQERISQIWSSGIDVKSVTSELADAVRVFLKIKKQTNMQRSQKNRGIKK